MLIRLASEYCIRRFQCGQIGGVGFDLNGRQGAELIKRGSRICALILLDLP